MKNAEKSSGQIEKTPAAIWVKKEGKLDLTALQDFGRFLLSRPEHREGRMACMQMAIDVPLEVTFFAEEPGSSDDVFHIKQNYQTASFEVNTIKGRRDRIDSLLEEFGLELVHK
ncbi:MAG: hypothetical protein Q7S52_00635 [bacterium]|nr:hypothetical protein [bacterium]